MAFLKRFLFRNLSLENYLRVLQRTYFTLYKTGILRWNKIYIYHYYVKKLIKDGDAVIDIGANLGYYSLLFSKWVGMTGKVYAVEPTPVYQKILMEMADKTTNIQLIPYALGTEESEIKMSLPTSGGYLHTGRAHIKEENDHTAKDIIFEAKMQTPQKVFNNIKKVDYIKCDAEGFEYIILINIAALISQFKPILQVEVAIENREKLDFFLQGIGYEKFVLYKNKLIPYHIAKDKDSEYEFIYIYDIQKLKDLDMIS